MKLFSGMDIFYYRVLSEESFSNIREQIPGLLSIIEKANPYRSGIYTVFSNNDSGPVYLKLLEPAKILITQWEAVYDEDVLTSLDNIVSKVDDWINRTVVDEYGRVFHNYRYALSFSLFLIGLGDGALHLAKTESQDDYERFVELAKRAYRLSGFYVLQENTPDYDFMTRINHT